MITNKIKQQLAQDISRWRSDGHIDSETYSVLAGRYEVSRFGLEGVLKYLGIIGGIMLLFGILGLITASSGSLGFGSAVCLGLAIGGFKTGNKFYRDPANRYPYSAKALFLASMLFSGAALVLFVHAANMDERSAIVFIGLLWLIPAFIVSYHFVNSFILVITVLLSFHWIGSWHRMFGRSTYVFSVQDPHAMVVFAIAVLVLGICHDICFREKYKSFYKIYVSLSLLYLNMSLLILSIWERDIQLLWVIAAFVAALAQILFGARMQRFVFTGYGLTFFGINLFTRYHEFFWDRMNKGLFFLAGGIILLGISIFFEWRQNRIQLRKRG